MHPTIVGATKSKTVYLGLVITIIGYLQSNLPLLKAILSPLVGEENIEMTMGALTMLLGLTVIIVRFQTDTALANK